MRALTFAPRYLRRTVDGIGGPAAALWRERDLLGLLFRRDLRIRTSGTLLGGVWMFAQPALQVVAYWFLLELVLGVRFPGAVPFVDYFLVGIVAWLMIADVLNRSLAVLGEFAPLYARAVFPLPILPLLPALVSGAVYAVAYTAVIAVVKGPGAALLAPGVILVLLLWLVPLCYLLALVGVFLRDLAQVFPFLITMTFFLTPILYMPEMLPEAMQAAMVFNPFADLMALVHGVLQGTEVTLGNVLRPLALWLLLLGPAWVLFHRAVPHVREAL
ncbi:efflux ABC-transporter, permease protein, putative [Thioalkalivibrio nitratireducens DSM 14787]|uniref:Efflux ABC-transporter, permease protein, putative n=1 Tax=Thioalkalivibrio nitratireducens (strain DSM 14787 / UNIQEM 213 / ALEN2) TaxID=1255043 RepID=L0DX78_THIND|nr:ABC transporter permease [Thioalkalivibrio nitratireducens]AGA33570.1 efflux ABC-transporter, permease protein, putative [Thioalkalivibrio nitratireducens DSM 14787]